jgi:class 3 adenylate cyclase
VAKVKTIGDAYWAISGLPEETDESAVRICNFALRQQELLVEMNLHNREWGNIELRVGCHTGVLVGGVIGSKQLSYEVFGRTNEIAEHHEQKAPHNGVLASVSTMQMAVKSGLYDFVKHSAVIDDKETFVVTRKGDGDVPRSGASSARSLRTGRAASPGGGQVLNGTGDRAKVMQFFGIGKAGARLRSAAASARSHVSTKDLPFVPTNEVDAPSGRHEAAYETEGCDDVAIDIPDGEADVATSHDPNGECTVDVGDPLAVLGSCCNQACEHADVEAAYYEFDTANKRERRQVTALLTGIMGFACMLAVLISVPAAQLGDAAAGIAVYAVAGVLGVVLFAFNRVVTIDRLRARLVYAAVMALSLLLMIGAALLTNLHTMIGFAIFVNFMVPLLISPPADIPLVVHIVFAVAGGTLTVFTQGQLDNATSLVVLFTAALLWIVFVVVWYGYIQDRLDRAQFAATVTADRASQRIIAEGNIQKQMLATMAPAHVQADMVALVASDAYRRGEPANMTHDLGNVTVCFCKIRTKGEHQNAEKAYGDIMEMHERVERLLAKFPLAVKIKTVGQTLVVAGPLHKAATAVECEMAARDVFGFAHEVVHGTHRGDGLALRAGVCTGDVMATVMGTDRIAYDTFGDTVNTASRCMSTTEEGTMQAAMSTKAVCGEEYDMPPGAVTKVFMKGKGDVAVFRY